jgi:D-glucuronyl C5-epimerase C-terminus
MHVARGRIRVLALVAAIILATSVIPTPRAQGSRGALPSPATDVQGALSFGFAATAYPIRSLVPTQWPYYTTTIVPLVDTGVHDAAGVRMYRIGSTLYNHPVDQAQYAIALIYSYLASGNVAYLDRARAQAQRLIDTAVASRGAIYFPYPFNFARHGVSADTMIAPWYSAMAQGQALTVFVRLFEITGDPAYRTAADLTFNSFKNPRAAGVPWTVLVNSAGYLWFEEYAKDPRPPDLTYNGHIFAIFGLWDYHRLTQDGDALLLLQGGLTTASRYYPNVRATNWISRYCLTHGVQNALYHAVHGTQFLTLYTLTGATEFARAADALNEDYPWPNISGTVYFSAGTFTGYRFSASGSIVATKPFTLSRASSAPYLARSRIFGRAGSWFLIGAGVWSGYWILETPRRAFAPGRLPSLNVLGYDPPRSVAFSAGAHTGLVFSPSGGVTASRTVVLARPSSAPTDERAVINGVPYLRITAGVWAGMYVPLSGVLTY